jgi:hypothetical protein
MGNISLQPGTGETVRIWSIRDQEEVARIERAPDLRHLAFSPGGKYLAALQKGGNLRVWLLRYEDLAAEACSRLTRNMTRSEWREYFGDEAYHPTCPQLPVPEIAEPLGRSFRRVRPGIPRMGLAAIARHDRAR